MKMHEKMEALVEELLDGQILLEEAKEEFEKVFIKKAFSRNSRHISKTANVLGIHRNTLSKRIASYTENRRKDKASGHSA